MENQPTTPNRPTFPVPPNAPTRPPTALEPVNFSNNVARVLFAE